MPRFSISGNTSFDGFRSFISCLESREGVISCFHAGKQFEKIGYQDGLKVGSDTLIRQLAKNVFRVADFSEQKMIDSVIDNFGTKSIKELHYCLDRRVFQKAYQYLYFGSESLIGLADLLRKVLPKQNFRRMLIDSGRPVIVNFNLRIDELDDMEREEITEILEYALKNRYRDPFLGKSFVHHDDVGADRIQSIKKVRLPINRSKIPES